MQDLKILLVQQDTIWHDPEANRKMLDDLLETAQQTNLIILPEMFTTGFSMESKLLAETMDGPTHRWMQTKAEATRTAVCGSVIIKKDNNYFNRFLWVHPDGLTVTYDKRHLFRMAEEHQYYTAGHRNVTIDHLGWKIRPQICYDLRFPVWSRNRMVDGQHEYDILLNVANWPEPRVSAWDTLLKARAIENHAFMVGVNRVGVDGKNVPYSGHSAVYGPKGNTIAHLEDKITARTINLKYTDLAHYRRHFPAQLDADEFEIKL